MIIIYKDNIPVACYDDVGPEGALKAYAEDYIPGPNSGYIKIENSGTATLTCDGIKYNAVFYLDFSR